MAAAARLILLPGLASDATMWRDQLAVLPQRYRPLVSDVHSRCDSIAAMAATLLAELDGDLVLCGASMGGIVAMETVRQAPQRIRGMALLGANASPETEDMRALRETAIEMFAQGRVEEVLKTNLPLAFHPSRAQDTTLLASYLGFVLQAGAAQLIRQNRAIMTRPDARSHLASVRCPVLVMCGDSDQLTPPDCSRQIARLIPRSELLLIEQCGHMLTMERPDEVNAALLGWLARTV